MSIYKDYSETDDPEFDVGEADTEEDIAGAVADANADDLDEEAMNEEEEDEIEEAVNIDPGQLF